MYEDLTIKQHKIYQNLFKFIFKNTYLNSIVQYLHETSFNTNPSKQKYNFHCNYKIANKIIQRYT